MKISDSQLETLEKAIQAYGKELVREYFGVTQQTIRNLQTGRYGLSSKNLLKLEELRIAMLNNRLPAGMQGINSNGPSVAMEATQADNRSDTAVERQLIAEWTLGLSKDELAKVIAFIAGLREQRN